MHYVDDPLCMYACTDDWLWLFVRPAAGGGRWNDRLCQGTVLPGVYSSLGSLLEGRQIDSIVVRVLAFDNVEPLTSSIMTIMIL